MPHFCPCAYPWRAYPDGMLIFFHLLLSLSTAQAAETISKAEFVQGIRNALPARFCLDKSYFRTCFPLSAEACLASAKTAVNACSTSLEAGLPAQLHQPADGQTWGQKIGSCAGAKFEAEHEKAKLGLPECSKPWKEQ
jgi:hypothetical protein